jgi:ABC-2 type transport system ATP-binding protein
MKEGKLYHVEDDPLKMIEEIKEENTYQEKRELIDEHVMSL